HREVRTDYTLSIYHGADAAGRSAQDRKAFFNCPHTRLRQMLRRAEASEPTVVRRVEDVIGPVTPIYDFARKHDLIANLHPGAAELPEIKRARPRPGDEVDRARHQPRQTKRFQQRA